MKQTMKQTIKNYALFLVGLFIASMGVALSTKAGLGTSPVAAVPYSVSIVNHALTFGWWLNIWSLLQVAVQVILLRKKCKPVEIIIQAVLALVYGYMTDFSCKLIDGIQVNTYFAQFLWMALGCFVLALGIWIQFKGGVAMLPGEAMNRAISKFPANGMKILKSCLMYFISSQRQSSALLQPANCKASAKAVSSPRSSSAILSSFTA